VKLCRRAHEFLRDGVSRNRLAFVIGKIERHERDFKLLLVE
jgi:hypothetical protein